MSWFAKRTATFSELLSKGHTLRGAAWMTYAYAGGMVLQGTYFVLLARTLHANGLGVFAGALAIVSVAAPFASWGAGNVLVMRTARDPNAYKASLGVALATISGIGGLLIGVVVVLAHTAFVGTAVAALLPPLAFSELWCGRIVELVAQSFQAHERLLVTANITVGGSALRLVAIVFYAATAPRASPLAWAVLYLACSAAAAAFSIIVLLTNLGHPAFDAARLRDTLRHGIFFAIGTASKSVYGDIDKAMLTEQGLAAAAGIYTAAYRVVAMAFAPAQALVYAANTRLYRDGEVGPLPVWRFARRAWPATAGYGIVVGGALFVAAPIVPALLGPTFASSVGALRLLAIMPAIWGTHYLFGDALMGAGSQAARSVVQCGVAALNIGLNLILIPAASWRGAAWASIISEGLLALVMVALLYRRSHEDPRPHRLVPA